MGFGDKEAVLLIILGHQFGRCHPDVSGYEHPWYAFDPAHWNVYDHGLGYMSGNEPALQFMNEPTVWAKCLRTRAPVYEFGAGRGQMLERELPNGQRQYEMKFGGESHCTRQSFTQFIAPFIHN